MVATDFDICRTTISETSEPFNRIIVARPNTSPSVPPEKMNHALTKMNRDPYL